ncbi:MAG: glycine cleavage system aminomethyltransferase GcvT [Thermodesulfobacteriota bacterium]
MHEKHTPLYDLHKELGAKMVSFAGWMMPVQYTGIIDEHRNVRSHVGLFDVSHMGEIEVSGPGALKAVEYVASNSASKLHNGKVQYTLLCNNDGGIVDDTTLYKLADDRYLFCVNAGNTEKDYRWIKEHAGNTARVENKSDSYAQFALQGPLSQELLQMFCKDNLSGLKYYHFIVTNLLGTPAIISRTGYTGEDGFEIYIQPEISKKLWKELLNKGVEFGIKPSGLGARDTLRMEMCYPLYGHELGDEVNPFEAGLEWIVKLSKGSFLGSMALEKIKKEGTNRKIIGLEMIDKGIPRSGYKISDGDKEIGYISSGTMSPSLGTAIGIGFVKPDFSHTGQQIFVEIRGRLAKAKVVRTPFYTKLRDENGE